MASSPLPDQRDFELLSQSEQNEPVEARIRCSVKHVVGGVAVLGLVLLVSSSLSGPKMQSSSMVPPTRTLNPYENLEEVHAPAPRPTPRPTPSPPTPAPPTPTPPTPAPTPRPTPAPTSRPMVVGDVVYCRNGDDMFAPGIVIGTNPLKVCPNLASAKYADAGGHVYDDCLTLQEQLTADTDDANDKNKKRHCSPTGESCATTQCCEDESMICFEKDDWWSGCRENCTVGGPEPGVPAENAQPWACHVNGGQHSKGLEMCECPMTDCTAGGVCDWSYDEDSARCGSGQVIRSDRKCLGWKVGA